MLALLILSNALIAIGKSVGVGFLSPVTLFICLLIELGSIVRIVKEELRLFLVLAIYFLMLDLLLFGFKDGLIFFACGVACYSTVLFIFVDGPKLRDDLILKFILITNVAILSFIEIKTHPGGLFFSRGNSETYNPNTIGFLMVGFLLLACSSRNFLRWYGVGAVLSTLLLIILMLSRSAALGCLVVSMLFFMKTRTRSYLILMLSCTLIALFIFMNRGDFLTQQLNERLSFSSAVVEHKTPAMKGMVQEYLFGSGFGVATNFAATMMKDSPIRNSMIVGASDSTYISLKRNFGLIILVIIALYFFRKYFSKYRDAFKTYFPFCIPLIPVSLAQNIPEASIPALVYIFAVKIAAKSKQ